eukprot:1148778-Pelagomonas_calceolata.AAC.8
MEATPPTGALLFSLLELTMPVLGMREDRTLKILCTACGRCTMVVRLCMAEDCVKVPDMDVMGRTPKILCTACRRCKGCAQCMAEDYVHGRLKGRGGPCPWLVAVQSTPCMLDLELGNSGIAKHAHLQRY